ncbi:hypothetical protein DSECCO2_620450 [anaerobic digester metagenome]
MTPRSIRFCATGPTPSAWPTCRPSASPGPGRRSPRSSGLRPIRPSPFSWRSRRTPWPSRSSGGSTPNIRPRRLPGWRRWGPAASSFTRTTRTPTPTTTSSRPTSPRTWWTATRTTSPFSTPIWPCSVNCASCRFLKAWTSTKTRRSCRWCAPATGSRLSSPWAGRGRPIPWSPPWPRRWPCRTTTPARSTCAPGATPCSWNFCKRSWAAGRRKAGSSSAAQATKGSWSSAGKRPSPRRAWNFAASARPPCACASTGPRKPFR